MPKEELCVSKRNGTLCLASLSRAQAMGTWLQMLSFFGPSSDLGGLVSWGPAFILSMRPFRCCTLVFQYQLGTSCRPESLLAPCWFKAVFKAGRGGGGMQWLHLGRTLRRTFSQWLHFSLVFGEQVCHSRSLVRTINDPACFFFSHFHNQLQTWENFFAPDANAMLVYHYLSRIQVP